MCRIEYLNTKTVFNWN